VTSVCHSNTLTYTKIISSAIVIAARQITITFFIYNEICLTSWDILPASICPPHKVSNGWKRSPVAVMLMNMYVNPPLRRLC
jgi:hypothetical protein